MSIEVQWDYGRKEATFMLEWVKLRPGEWVPCGSVLNREPFLDIWEEVVYPTRYYLNLEDNVTTKEEIKDGRKILYAKYDPPPTRRSRLKKFLEWATLRK